MAWERVGPDGCWRIGRGAAGQSAVHEGSGRWIAIITYYGYCDGSGEYYIVIDAEKCDSCGKCVAACPQKALLMETQLIDLEDKNVAAVAEEHRKKVRYTCQPCNPQTGKVPCVFACSRNAVKCVWSPR